MTFIQLLSLIEPNEHNIKLVLNRLFEMPTVKNPIKPFVLSSESREAAFDFLQRKEATPFVLNYLLSLLEVPFQNTKMSDDFTYKGRSGLYNLQSTCYLTAILQSLNALPNFTANLLSLDDDSLTPFVIQL